MSPVFMTLLLWSLYLPSSTLPQCQGDILLSNDYLDCEFACGIGFTKGTNCKSIGREKKSIEKCGANKDKKKKICKRVKLAEGTISNTMLAMHKFYQEQLCGDNAKPDSPCRYEKTIPYGSALSEQQKQTSVAQAKEFAKQVPPKIADKPQRQPMTINDITKRSPFEDQQKRAIVIEHKPDDGVTILSKYFDSLQKPKIHKGLYDHRAGGSVDEILPQLELSNQQGNKARYLHEIDNYIENGMYHKQEDAIYDYEPYGKYGHGNRVNAMTDVLYMVSFMALVYCIYCLCMSVCMVFAGCGCFVAKQYDIPKSLDCCDHSVCIDM